MCYWIAVSYHMEYVGIAGANNTHTPAFAISPICCQFVYHNGVCIAEARKFNKHPVNTMATDDQAPCDGRLSTAKVMAIWYTWSAKFCGKEMTEICMHSNFLNDI